MTRQNQMLTVLNAISMTESWNGESRGVEGRYFCETVLNRDSSQGRAEAEQNVNRVCWGGCC